jgi:lipopolysaccharide/colanic/teichoic acid biosynthesis glycosyltransferase
MNSPHLRRRADAAARAGRDFNGGSGRLVRVTALPLADAAGLAGAIAVSGAARRPLACALYAAAVLVIMAARRQHRLRVCLRASDQAGVIVTAAVLPLPALLAWLPGRRLAVLALCCTGFVLACRVAACGALRAAHRRGRLTEPAVVVGAGTFGGYVAGLMRDHPEFGLWPAGLVDDGPPRRDLPVPTLGTTGRLRDVLADHGIGRVIVCFSSDCRDEDLVAVLRAAASRPLGADVCVVPRFYELGMAVPRGCLDELWGVPLIPLRRPPRTGLAVKRAADLAAALVLAPVAVPLALALAAMTRLRSGPPATFRQERLTGDGSVTPILKLRTVPVQAGLETSWAVPADRCDPFARWLRATHLDELPQLLNVLRGEMSLCGPRPERPSFAERFRREIPRYADRTRMPGGLTGWAQVNGLNGDTSVFDRARFDNYYAEYWSPWFDAVILAQTALIVARTALRVPPAARSPADTTPVTVRAWP